MLTPRGIGPRSFIRYLESALFEIEIALIPPSPIASPKLWLYDTTLRDGAQREGISLSLADKLRIAQALDDLGVPFIEGGWPGANPKDVQFFWQLQQQPLRQAEVIAFCSTCRPGQRAETDDLLQAILAAGTRWVTLFGKSWDLHVTAGLNTSLEENLRMITDSIAYLRLQGRRVIYDAEHWFDGYKNNPEYAIKTLQAALEAGAEWLTLCDTNGGTLPHEVTAIVQENRSTLGTVPPLGIHTHNDSETAVANAIAAVLAGATLVQGTINGYGERCGNANLCSLIPNLQLKLGYDCIAPEQLARLTATSRLVSEVVNLAPHDHAAFVGQSAFAHKGGIHVSAVARNPLTYEHIDPGSVGNGRRIVVSEQSGLSNVLAKARSFGLELEKQDPASRALLAQIKALEHQGYQFEAADASLELLMRRVIGMQSASSNAGPTSAGAPFFSLKEFQVHCGHRGDSLTATVSSLATIKVTVNDQDILQAGEGDGPVEALDRALRKALEAFYPEVAQFYLTDYKVRILNSSSGTAATTRVLVESSDGSRRWSTLGVSTNIIEASYEAVVEGIEYGLMQTRAACSLAARGLGPKVMSTIGPKMEPKIGPETRPEMAREPLPEKP